MKFVEGAVMPNGNKSDGLDWMMEFDGKIQHYFRWRSGSKYLVLYTSGSEDAVMIHIESLEWRTAGKEAGSDKSAPAANRSKQKKTDEAKNASR